MSRKRTIVLSDVHLSQTHPADPADPMWMRYRQADRHPDEEFAALVDHALEAFAGDAIELVFNGDVLDFDAPWVKDGESSFDEFPLDDAGCAEHAERILADHPVWFGAVARLLLAGHRVLFLSGNHDLELYWPGARAAIRDHLARLVRAEAGRVSAAVSPDQIASSIDERVRFRTWFHVTEDAIYLEHGSQYDIFNGVPWAMLPVTAKRSWIHPVMGKLAFKRTGSRMGYFNPYYEETFYMGLFGYLAHFLSRYAFSRRRHIVRTWFFGALSTSAEIWRGRHAEDWTEKNRALAMAETGASAAAVDGTQALRANLAETTMLPILRELWLDRLLLATVLAVVVGLAALVLGTLGALVAGGVGLACFVAYEVKTPKPDIRTYDSAPECVKELFGLHGVRAICLGHTHRPYASWDEGRFLGNSGSWCPAFHDPECTRRVLAKRPVLILTSDPERMVGGLFWWADGSLEPAGDATLPLADRSVQRAASSDRAVEPKAEPPAEGVAPAPAG